MFKCGMLLCLIMSTQTYKIELIYGSVVVNILGLYSLALSGVRSFSWKKRKYAPAKLYYYGAQNRRSLTFIVNLLFCNVW